MIRAVFKIGNEGKRIRGSIKGESPRLICQIFKKTVFKFDRRGLNHFSLVDYYSLAELQRKPGFISFTLNVMCVRVKFNAAKKTGKSNCYFDNGKRTRIK